MLDAMQVHQHKKDNQRLIPIGEWTTVCAWNPVAQID
jgi:hypothetical protein